MQYTKADCGLRGVHHWAYKSIDQNASVVDLLTKPELADRDLLAADS